MLYYGGTWPHVMTGNDYFRETQWKSDLPGNKGIYFFINFTFFLPLVWERRNDYQIINKSSVLFSFTRII